MVGQAIASLQPEASRAIDLDAELVRVGRSELQLKLRIGECLDALFVQMGHHELGFSSIEAYVVERAHRSRSWGREARGLARRIRTSGLEGLRRAVIEGRIGWSMAELLSRRATRETEATLLEEASRKTIRAMQLGWAGNSSAEGGETAAEVEQPEIQATRQVTTSERVELAASRILVEYLNGARPDDEAFISALLAEGFTALQSLAERRGEGPAGLPVELDMEVLRATLLAAQAARRPSKHVAAPVGAPVPVPVAEDWSLPDTNHALDDEIRRCTRELARRNLRLGTLFRAFMACRGWLALGYESAAHYASERIGLSISSLQHRVTLARIAARYPDVGEALEEGAIGYEAALMIGRVLGHGATRDLAKAWVERAKGTTIKFLRDESLAVLTVAAMDPTTPRSPPSKEDLEAYFDFERSVQNGELLRAAAAASREASQDSGTPAAPAPPRSMARPLRMTFSPELYLHWREVETFFRALASPHASFVDFLCRSLWDAWLPWLEVWDDGWKELYRRDRCRCSNPVCERRDLTPHHDGYPPPGAPDDPERMATLCEFCHLRGIHEGRIKITGDASARTWTIGRIPILVVKDREKVELT